MKALPLNQLSIFDIIPLLSKEIEEPIKIDFFDDMMAKLEKVNEMASAQNELLKGMIDELQKDWSDDQKLMCNNPKEYFKQQKLKDQELNKEQEMAKELSPEVIEVLKKCTVDGLTVKLPEGQLDRKTYTDVKNKLELIGGKWKGGKVMGFVFNEDPLELLEQIANGENRNLKKEFQFFATPDKLADRLVELADIKDGQMILEPSAGQGAIIKAIIKAFPRAMKHQNDEPCVTIDYCELMPVNQTMLGKLCHCKHRHSFMGEDFLSFEPTQLYDRIIANPPFSKNQDIDHVSHMYKHLKNGGRLVSIMSRHWMESSNKKEVAFRNFLDEVAAEIELIDAGEFSESGTNIATCIVIINK